MIGLLLTMALATPNLATPGAVTPDVAPSSGGLGYLQAGALADRCGENSAASASYCYAYVAAVHDTMKAYEVWLNQREFCAPPNVSQAELRAVFVNYIRAYPTNRSGQAASVIVVALKSLYPCSPNVKPEAGPAPADRAKSPPAKAR